MSDKFREDEGQPRPEPNEYPAAWLLVIDEVEKGFILAQYAGPTAMLMVADMKERHEFGTKKYGTPLQPFNGRNTMRDMYAEVLDALVYAKVGCLEQPGNDFWQKHYRSLLIRAANIRAEIALVEGV